MVPTRAMVTAAQVMRVPMDSMLALLLPDATTPSQ